MSRLKNGAIPYPAPPKGTKLPSHIYYANGYCAIVYFKGMGLWGTDNGAWWAINTTILIQNIHTDGSLGTMSNKKARRKALKYLFRLPKRN